MFLNTVTNHKKISFLKSVSINNFQKENESEEYNACRFTVNNHRIVFRTAKITPKKVGQFVTFWKRNPEKGIIEPFESNDPFDFFIIEASNEQHDGIFLFPKPLLVEKRIISSPTKEGKRALRVYPPWDEVISNQARLTQSWQSKHFYSLEDDILPKPLMEALE